MSSSKCLRMYVFLLCLAVVVVCVSISVSMNYRGRTHYRRLVSHTHTEYPLSAIRLPAVPIQLNLTTSPVASSTVAGALSNYFSLPLVASDGSEEYINKDDFKSCHRKMTDCKKRLPQAIVVGAKKCGTGTLRYFLRVHPQVAFSPYVEVHYFDSPRNYKMGINWYRSRMRLSRPDQVTVEKTPRYFVSSVAPFKIHDEVSPNTKIIILMRDPVARSVSDYLAVRHMEGLTEKTRHNSSTQTPPYTDPIYDVRPYFEDSVLEADGSVKAWNGLINIGLYSNHVRRWLDVFPRKQILALDSDILTRDPLQTLKSIEKFLGLKPFFHKEHFHLNKKKGFYCLKISGKVSCQGSSKGRKHPSVEQSVIDKLREFYKPYDKELVTLLKQNFSWV